MNLSRLLYRAARASRDLESLRSPQTAVKRQRNKLIGRALWRVFGRLFR
jgi:hypothetical protein